MTVMTAGSKITESFIKIWFNKLISQSISFGFQNQMKFNREAAFFIFVIIFAKFKIDYQLIFVIYLETHNLFRLFNRDSEVKNH